MKKQEIIDKLSKSNTYLSLSEEQTNLIANELNNEFKPSFQKITILKGEKYSGKTTEAINIIGKRTYFDINEIPHQHQIIFKTKEEVPEVLLFEDYFDINEIKKIIEFDYPKEIKEIIICVTI